MPTSDERNLWLPPSRMRRYQVSKVVAALLITCIFVGWAVVQWSNVFIRWLAAACIVFTCWITIKSIVVDVRRGRGRQLAIVGDGLEIVTPGGASRITFADIAHAEWHNEPAPAMRLIGHDGQALAELDEGFLADEAEARTFIGWARRRAELPFEVTWPRQT